MGGSRLLDRLARGETLLADGALGTLLIARGLRSGESPEGFGLEHPEILREIAGAYIEAGAEIVQTNTFGASPLKLAGYGLADRFEEINRAAVAAVRDAVADRAIVMACCGTSGRLLKPYGDAEPAEVAESFRQQVRVLSAAGVDAINFETMIDLNEAVLAVQAAKSVAPDLPVSATLTFESRRRGFFTVMGNTIPQSAAALIQAGADIVGSNCGNGSAAMVAVAREFQTAGARWVSIRANAGLPVPDRDLLRYPETPEFMAGCLPELLACGVSIVGGCCGTTPDHIRAFRSVLHGYRIRNTAHRE